MSTGTGVNMSCALDGSDLCQNWDIKTDQGNRFNVNLGTGAVSIVIGNVPYAFDRQHALGQSPIPAQDRSSAHRQKDKLRLTGCRVHLLHPKYHILPHQRDDGHHSGYQVSPSIQTIILRPFRGGLVPDLDAGYGDSHDRDYDLRYPQVWCTSPSDLFS